MSGGFYRAFPDDIVVARFKGKRHRPFPSEHYHNTHEIYYLENGSQTYYMYGKEYRISGGDIVFIPAGAEHHAIRDDRTKEYSRVLVEVHDSFIPEELKAAKDKCFELVVFSAQAQDKPEIHNLFFALNDEYCLSDEFSAFNMAGILGSIFSFAVRKSLPKDENPVVHPSIQTAVKFIEANYKNDVSLETVAYECGFSREHLSRLFKKEMSVCFQDYVLSVKLKNAKRLLATTELSVLQVALECGFNNSGYFSHIFKENSLISPSEYRKVNNNI